MRKSGARIASALALLVVVSAAPPLPAPAQGQGGATPFEPEELEQIVAPIALYPDPLLAQVLMASTYPLEIVQAARFAKAQPDLKGDPLNEALKQQTWDDSVKSLVAFPQVLTMLNDKLDWTQKLGDAVLGQQPDVMAAVQRLRAKAQAEGNLQTTAQQTVAAAPATAGAPQQTIITIEPANPQVVCHIAVADAVCYLFGAFGVIQFCSSWGPRLLGIDLRDEAKKLEAALGIRRATPGTTPARNVFELRAYRVQPDGAAAGRTVAETEALIPGSRVFVQRVRHNGEIRDADPTTVLEKGDVVAVSGRREVLVDVIGRKAEEVEDVELLDVAAAVFDVVVTNKALAGRPLGDVAQDPAFRGVHVRSLSRGGHDIPSAPGVTLDRGDVLRLVGPEPAVERAGTLVGTIVRPSDSTDFVTLGLAIFAGGLLGIVIALPIGNLRISLSTSVGTLLAGLLVGWLRSVRPLFGRIPNGAVSFMTSLGLAAFVGMVGLHAGPVFVSAVREVGFGLVIGGAVVTLTPQVAGLYFGRYVLRMNPLLLLGALAGAQTMTAALAAVQDKSGSPIAVLGYTGAVPFGHILLTTWGTVIVWLVTRAS